MREYRGKSGKTLGGGVGHIGRTGPKALAPRTISTRGPDGTARAKGPGSSPLKAPCRPLFNDAGCVRAAGGGASIGRPIARPSTRSARQRDQDAATMSPTLRRREARGRGHAPEPRRDHTRAWPGLAWPGREALKGRSGRCHGLRARLPRGEGEPGRAPCREVYRSRQGGHAGAGRPRHRLFNGASTSEPRRSVCTAPAEPSMRGAPRQGSAARHRCAPRDPQCGESGK